MPKDRSLVTIMAEALKAEKDALVPRVAEHSRPVYGNERVMPDERRRRFWQEAPGWSPEKEMRLLTGLNPDGTPIIDPETMKPAAPMSPRAVGLLRFPNREIDAKAGGRVKLADQARYMKEMAELGPPPPDPLEAMAMQTEDADGSVGLGDGSPEVQLPPVADPSAAGGGMPSLPPTPVAAPVVPGGL